MLPLTGTQVQQQVTAGRLTVKKEEQCHQGTEKNSESTMVWGHLESPGTSAFHNTELKNQGQVALLLPPHQNPLPLFHATRTLILFGK